MSAITPTPRPTTLYIGDEKAQLGRWLDFYRATLLNKCAGLDEVTLKQQVVPTSRLTLLGLLRHMAGVEEWWFQEKIEGGSPRYSYDASVDPDVDFNDLNGADVATVEANFDRAVAASRAILARHEMDDLAASTAWDGSALNVRWVGHHMLEEYARHLGHADLLRELIDGATGY